MVLKYKKVAFEISRQIADGKYTDKLPSEAELVEKYNTSRNTIRNAMDALFEQGLIKRVQGSGYFINVPLHRDGYFMNIAGKNGLGSLGKRTIIKSKVNALKVIPAGKEIAAHLDCDPDDQVYYVSRLRFSNKDLVSLEHAYYLKQQVPYLNKEICEDSIFSFIVENYDIEVTNADEYVSVYSLGENEAQESKQPVGTPTLKIEEINCTKNEHPFNYSNSFYFQKGMTVYMHINNSLS